jgi:hypothetical protein
MSYLHIVKKTNPIYIWLAVDRVRGQVVDFEELAQETLAPTYTYGAKI